MGSHFCIVIAILKLTRTLIFALRPHTKLIFMYTDYQADIGILVISARKGEFEAG